MEGYVQICAENRRGGGGVVLAADLEPFAMYGITRFHQLIAAGEEGELRLLLWEDEFLSVGAVQAALQNPNAPRAENLDFLE